MKRKGGDPSMPYLETLKSFWYKFFSFISNRGDSSMPQGPGTYGPKRGRPPGKSKTKKKRCGTY
jgi:hypothetical protein